MQPYLWFVIDTVVIYTVCLYQVMWYVHVHVRVYLYSQTLLYNSASGETDHAINRLLILCYLRFKIDTFKIYHGEIYVESNIIKNSFENSY